jgi:histidinol-phosphate aminotransferase
VDEAYIDFGGDSALALVERYPNLIVVQTLSKSRALAGARVGFAIAQPGLIEALVRVKDSFNSYPINRLSEAAAVASFADEDYFQAKRQAVIDTRERTVTALQALGFDILPSAANFVLAKPSKMAANVLFQGLREQGILVRYFNKPRLSEYLRISIGTDSEMDALIAAITQLQ